MLAVLDPLERWLVTTFGLPEILVTPALVVVLTVVVDLLVWLITWRLGPRLERTRNRWDDTVLIAVRRPLRVWVWGTGAIALAGLAGLRFSLEWLTEHVGTALWLLSLAMLAWAGLRLARLIEQRLVFPPARHPAKPLDATTASAISKILGAVVLVVVALAMLEAFGMSLSGLLAFGGLGGLVVGFAVRDVLANFFGGLAIHLDSPFKVGDWVSSPDREIEGVVEDIGWRLTRIRAFDSRPLYVPNMLFGSIVVKNPSRMLNRRIFETLGLRYDDIGQVETIVSRIRALLEAHEQIDHDQMLLVNFTTYGDYSLDIFIHAYTRTTDWGEYQAAKQEILLSIGALIAEQGAAMALPVRELHLAEALTLAQAEGHHDEGHKAPASQQPASRADSAKAMRGSSLSASRGDAPSHSSSDSNQETDA